MSNIVPFGFSFQSDSLPAPSEISPLPAGQSQIITMFCDPEHQPFLTETLIHWFDDEDWDHVIYRGHGISEKQEQAFITLEWEGCYIDAFFLQMLRKEEPVIDFVTYIRDGRV